MPEALERARALYESAHRADDVGRFDDALAGFRALLTELDGADLDGELRAGAALRVRALLGIARGLYESTGDLAGALASLDDAEQVATSTGLPEELVAVQGQRGLLMMRSGDVRAALAALDAVVPGPDAEPTRDLAVILLNRGALNLDYGDPDQAERDLRDAADVAARAGVPNLEAMARHNLGLLSVVRGDLPAALRQMTEASELGETPQPVALLDRARVLRDAGLMTDAVTALDMAAELLVGGSLLDRGEVELIRAACLMDLRQHGRAVEAAQAAVVAFERAGNAPWAARARVMELEALLAADRFTTTRAPDETLLDRADRALELAAAGAAGVFGRFMVTYPALLAAAEWAAMAGDVEAARLHLGRVPVDLANAPLSLRLTRPAVVARLAFATGHRAAGVRAVRRGQAELFAHRGLGSVEAVAAAGVHAMQLNLVDTQAALATGDPGAFFDALERGRAAAAGAARLVPPDDAVLADLLARARAEHQAAIALGPTATAEGLHRKRQHLLQARRLQEQARERSWQIEGERRPVEPATARTVRAALRALDGDDRGTVVVSYATIAGEALAVRVDAHGASLHTLAARDEVTELARRARADYAVVANVLIPAPLRQSATASLTRTLARLDELLLAPLAVDGGLYVVARGRHLTIPWASLPSRAGRRTWVQDRVELHSRLVDARGGRAGGVVVLAGPGTDGGHAEAAAVADVWPGARLVTGAAATTAAATEALRHADVVHIAAHGGHAVDNAMFSTLRLADGPLFAHELDGVDLTGAVVVLSACELGESTSDVGGEELGFAGVLLRHGARAVVAAVAPLRDDVAGRVMPRLHGALREGLLPGAALAAATGGEPGPVPLVCFGPMIV